MIDTGALTDAALELLESSGLLVGDAVAPAGGGWEKGQPKAGRFVPYCTLVIVGSGVRSTPLSEHSDDFDVSFSLKSFGGSRKQVDWAANASRASVEPLRRLRFGTYVVSAVIWQSLGGVSRIDSVDPPYWQIADSFSLVCMNDE